MKSPASIRQLGQSALRVGPIAYGLWRFVGNDVKAARARVEAALDAGLTWSPLAGGRLADDSAGGHTDAGARLNRVTGELDRIAKRDGTARVAVALAFVMRHPSRPIPIVGTQNIERLAALCDAMRVQLSRADWYAIVVASNGKPLP